MSVIQLLTIFLATGNVLAQEKFRQDIHYSEKRVLEEGYYAIFNHNTEWWDRERSSEKGTLKLLETLKHMDRSFKLIGSFDSDVLFKKEKNNGYYLNSNDVNYSLISIGGSHELSFPNARALIFSGGKFSECLCESIRDAIKNSTSLEKQLNILLVTDAIYDPSFFVNNYLEHRGLHGMGVFPITLQRILSALTVEEKKDYFVNSLTGEGRFCPYAYNTDTDEKRGNLKEYKFILKENGIEIGSWGSGPKVVQINLSETDSLAEQILKSDE